MNQKANPMYKKGKRNALCPHYRSCLDNAVKKSWEYWECSKCLHKQSRAPSLDAFPAVNDTVTFFHLPEKFDGEYY
jgi:hypothetical protein